MNSFANIENKNKGNFHSQIDLRDAQAAILNPEPWLQLPNQLVAD